MDLAAFAQIDDLSALAQANGIEVPRLRGYRLMSEEKPVGPEKLEKIVKEHEFRVLEDSLWNISRGDMDKLTRKYLIRETVTDVNEDGSESSYEKTVGFRWDLVHGKRRKELKFALKKARKAVLAQFETFNRYAGRSDVLYIHARIGGGNWMYYGGDELAKQPWFLEKVDDHFDDTYCDIYASLAQ